MIASYKYGFIFIRTKKTASTAVELGLSTICGPDDVISPIGAGQEILRSELGGSPRNFNKDKALEERFAVAVKTRSRDAIREVGQENRSSGGCTGHMKASAVKALVSEDFWSKAYKFTTERHPYEKALSLAHFRYSTKLAKTVKFEEHLEHVVKEQWRTYSSSRIYCIDGRPAMDGYLLHASLADDIANLRERLGLPPFELPRARAKRSDRRSADEVLTDDQKEFIVSRCKLEFELFKWKQ